MDDKWHGFEFLLGILFALIVLAVIKISVYGIDAAYCG